MSYQEDLNSEFAVIEEETLQVMDQVHAYQRKLLAPVWNKRREIVKKIPGFWAQTLGNSPLFNDNPKDVDIDSLENLTDFHVEYDENRPNYRKVIATFSKNDVFKNETLTKEFIIDPEDKGTVVSKTTIDWHEGKKPNQLKRKAGNDDEEDAEISFLGWFEDDSVDAGIFLTDDLFPQASDYYRGGEEEDDDEDEDEEIELGSDSEEEEEEKPQKKKSKK